MLRKKQAEIIATELVAQAKGERREASSKWQFAPSFVPWYYLSPGLRKLSPAHRHALLREAKAKAAARASTALWVSLLLAVAVAVSVWPRFLDANREYLLIVPVAIAIAWIVQVRIELAKLLRRRVVTGGSSVVA